MQESDGDSQTAPDHRLSRRTVLRTAAAGGLATAFVGEASARGRPPARIVGTASRDAEREARGRAESVKRVLDFGGIGKAVAGRFSDRAAAELERRDDVRYVETDGRVEAYGQTLPWGIDRVDADVAHADGETGAGAHVAIVDTGIDDDHPDLQRNVGRGKSFVKCTGKNCNYAWSDDNDHGTHCAGIADAVDDGRGVVGVSTEATLHAVKVLDDAGSGSISDVAAGVEYVADQGWDVASMSLGASSGYATLEDACRYAYEKGVLLVASAGNSGPCTDCVGYPAAYSTVVAVSSTDADDTLSGFSSTGPEVELAAPGGRVYSTVIGGYDTFSGTSMACPHVSGAGAQLMANGYTNVEARDRLTATAEDIGLAENESGAGLLDVEAALGGSTSDPSVAVSTGSATDVGETGATLNGSLDDLGGASSADCYVEYRESGASSWTATGAQTLSAAGSFSESVGGLADGVDYEFRAVADASDGDTAAGSAAAFTTTDDPPAVSTGSATNVGDTSATLGGTLDDLGNAESADCYVEYRESGASSWTATAAETRTATGSFERDVTGLASGTDYEFRAVTDASDGDGATGGTASFATTGGGSTGDAAPTVDAYAVTEAGSPNPHAEITADWDVGDADGDLDRVVVEVFEAGTTNLVDSRTHGVGGADATGTDQFTVKHARGGSYDVTLTVTDASGNGASATRTVSE